MTGDCGWTEGLRRKSNSPERRSVVFMDETERIDDKKLSTYARFLDLKSNDNIKWHESPIPEVSDALS